jgi:hypothetical protein
MLERKSFYFVRDGKSEYNQRRLVTGGKKLLLIGGILP